VLDGIRWTPLAPIGRAPEGSIVDGLSRRSGRTLSKKIGDLPGWSPMREGVMEERSNLAASNGSMFLAPGIYRALPTAETACGACHRVGQQLDLRNRHPEIAGWLEGQNGNVHWRDQTRRGHARDTGNDEGPHAPMRAARASLASRRARAPAVPHRGSVHLIPTETPLWARDRPA